MPRVIRADGFIRPFVPLLSWLTARYIARQRRRVLPYTEPIAARFCSEFRPFFPPEILGDTRVAQASVPNPRFYFLVKLLGIRGVLEMSAIGAITLVDVIAYPEKIESKDSVSRTRACRSVSCARIASICKALCDGVP